MALMSETHIPDEINCPECEQPFLPLRRPNRYQLLQCPHCDGILVVRADSPLWIVSAVDYAIEFSEW